MSGTPCPRPGCTGSIVDGYCDVDGLAPPRRRLPAPSGPPVGAPLPPPGPPAPAVLSGVGPTPPRRPSTTASPRPPRRAAAQGLVPLPRVASGDPRARLKSDARIPEQRRFCTRCREPVGRSRQAGVPGLTEGFCPHCRQAFSFRPSLSPGDVVAGQYEVAGCLAHGGLGWIYLAIDRNVADRWVVLKGTLDHDGSAEELALAERRFLAEVEHPNIVKIHNFVEHGDERFIVMEFVNGVSLRHLLDERNAAGGPWEPMPAAEAVALVVEVLPALSHLHERGLVYCDLKPDNIMVSDGGVKLIDLGAVYRLDEPGDQVWGTPGYQAPEIATQGPSPASDVFTVGRTLAVLVADLRGSSTVLPPPDVVPTFAQHDSLYRVLRRATAPDPAARFPTVEDLSHQLEAVLREIVAGETGTPRPAPSHLFTGELTATLDRPCWTSVPSLLVDAGDPMAGYLAAISANDAAGALDLLDRAPEATTEVALRRALTLVGLGRGAEAGAVLDDLRRTGRGGWRVDWYEGLRRLAGGDGGSAVPWFRAVYEAVPGELAPRVALGVATELAGDRAAARGWYGIVVQTDPSHRAAVFGLARCRAHLGDVRGAAAALAAVPPSSAAHAAAQVERVALLVRQAGRPGVDAGTRWGAVEAAEGLPAGEPRRLELLAAALENELEALRRARDRRGAGAAPDPPRDEPAVRRALEATYRAMGKRAATLDERVALVDRANRVRPRSMT